jgi:hypothetical protein
MNESISKSHKIALLNQGNYYSWADAVKGLLLLRDLRDVLSHEVALDDDGEPEDVNVALRSEKARALLLQTISPKLQGLVRRHVYANQVWQALESHFKARSASRAVELQQRLASAKQRNGEDLTAFFIRVEELSTELVEGCAKEVSDEQITGIVLAGVLPVFNQTLEAIRAMPSVNLEYVKAVLLAAETRHRERKRDAGVEGKALAMTNSKQKQRPGKETRKCFNCGKIGHLKRDCREKLAHENGEDGRCLMMTRLQGDRLSQEDSILFDTCASHHMVSSELFFDALEPADVPTVYCGGGESHAVLGQGKVSISSKHGIVHLVDALCVPTLKTNVMSGLLALERGIQLRNHGASVKLVKAGEVWLNARNASGILQIEGQLLKKKATVCAVVSRHTSAEVWHKRFGHVSDAMLSKTLLADGIEYEAMKDSSVAKNCGVCQLAKLLANRVQRKCLNWFMQT